MRRRRVRRSAAPFLGVLVLVAGCAEGAGTEPAGGPAIPAEMTAATDTAAPAAVEIARRTAPVGGIPQVVGADLDEARGSLARAGARTQAVVFAHGAPVTAQYPHGGRPLPPDGVVTVWLGDPPGVPPPAPAADPAPPPEAVQRAVALDPLPAGPGGPPEQHDAPDADTGRKHDPASDRSHDAPRTAASPRQSGNPSGKVLEGPATWYGPGFMGDATACGGRFSPNELTMASRELSCGTLVRVTGPTGHSVDVTVTDWGPAEWTGNRFDLSAAAFAEIAQLAAGVVPVTVEMLRR